MPGAPSKRIFRFATFEVDPASGELRKHGIRLKLQDQPFKILLALLEKPGEVVTREELRKTIWGDTFVDFDHGLNAAINRLREALGDSAENPRYIETLARRGYRFLAPVEGPPQPEAAAPGRSRRKLVWAALALAAIAIGIGLWLVLDREAASGAPRVVRLTGFAGVETDPAFSPDGTRVAFAWNGEKEDNADIYVKIVGSAAVQRLTLDPALDQYPAWSPNGKQIAFVSNRGTSGIYLVSPIGGMERKLVDLDIQSRPSWSPDGKFLAVAKSYVAASPDADGSVWLIPVESGGQPRRILTPQPGTWYESPTFSPDGRQLAVGSCTGWCQLQMVDLNRELLPQGKPWSIRLPSEGGPGWRSGFAWSGKGDFLVVSGSVTTVFEPWLWRVPVGAAGEPQRLEAAGAWATHPAIDARSNRIAFVRNLGRREIWRWERGGTPAAFLTSSLGEYSPQFSPDGQRIAFESRRGGEESAVWIANANGAGLTQVTQGTSSYCGTPRWSPDNRWIAFDAAGKDHGWNVWVVEASGGPARQLTHGPADNDNAIPSWSRDGKWVYFKSQRSGRYEIWRVPAQGGPAERVTRDGGYVGFQSPDGETLYYTKSEGGSEGLFAMPSAGGAERQVLRDRVIMRGFAVFSEGIYYLSSREESVRLFGALYGPQGAPRWKWNEIRFHEFASGRARRVLEIEGPLAMGFSVSGDQKTFLYSRAIPAADLMLIENFR